MHFCITFLANSFSSKSILLNWKKLHIPLICSKMRVDARSSSKHRGTPSQNETPMKLKKTISMLEEENEKLRSKIQILLNDSDLSNDGKFGIQKHDRDGKLILHPVFAFNEKKKNPDMMELKIFNILKSRCNFYIFSLARILFALHEYTAAVKNMKTDFNKYEGRSRAAK